MTILEIGIVSSCFCALAMCCYETEGNELQGTTRTETVWLRLDKIREKSKTKSRRVRKGIIETETQKGGDCSCSYSLVSGALAVRHRDEPFL